MNGAADTTCVECISDSEFKELNEPSRWSRFTLALISKEYNVRCSRETKDYSSLSVPRFRLKLNRECDIDSGRLSTDEIDAREVRGLITGLGVASKSWLSLS